MNSWWEFGEGGGSDGDSPHYRIECPFCGLRGKFVAKYAETRSDPRSKKALTYETLACTGCANLTQILWTRPTHVVGRPLHSFQQLPWPLDSKLTPSMRWPASVGRYWVQASDNLSRKNFESAAMAARTALQLVARERGAVGRNLREEIDDLGVKERLPPHMIEWAHQVIREPANDATHPSPDAAPMEAKDARDVLGYLDFLLEHLYDLPARVAEFRGRTAGT